MSCYNVRVKWQKCIVDLVAWEAVQVNTIAMEIQLFNEILICPRVLGQMPYIYAYIHTHI